MRCEAEQGVDISLSAAPTAHPFLSRRRRCTRPTTRGFAPRGGSLRRRRQVHTQPDVSQERDLASQVAVRSVDGTKSAIGVSASARAGRWRRATSTSRSRATQIETVVGCQIQRRFNVVLVLQADDQRYSCARHSRSFSQGTMRIGAVTRNSFKRTGASCVNRESWCRGSAGARLVFRADTRRTRS